MLTSIVGTGAATPPLAIAGVVALAGASATGVPADWLGINPTTPPNAPPGLRIAVGTARFAVEVLSTAMVVVRELPPPGRGSKVEVLEREVVSETGASTMGGEVGVSVGVVADSVVEVRVELSVSDVVVSVGSGCRLVAESVTVAVVSVGRGASVLPSLEVTAVSVDVAKVSVEVSVAEMTVSDVVVAGGFCTRLVRMASEGRGIKITPTPPVGMTTGTPPGMAVAETEMSVAVPIAPLALSGKTVTVEAGAVTVTVTVWPLPPRTRPKRLRKPSARLKEADGLASFWRGSTAP